MADLFRVKSPQTEAFAIGGCTVSPLTYL